MEKQCRKCKLLLPASCFYKQIKAKDKLHYYCKKCSYLKVKQWNALHKERVYKKHKEWKLKAKDSLLKTYQRKLDNGFTKANNAVMKAIREGKLKRLSKEIVACVDCGNRAFHYDHRNYNLPLEVEPVCRSCNRKRGSAIYV